MGQRLVNPVIPPGCVDVQPDLRPRAIVAGQIGVDRGQQHSVLTGIRLTFGRILGGQHTLRQQPDIVRRDRLYRRDARGIKRFAKHARRAGQLVGHIGPIAIGGQTKTRLGQYLGE